MEAGITGVILAGGDNTRFKGITKSNVVVGGRTIISRMIDAMKGIFDNIIIVTNKRGEFSDYENFQITGDHFLKKGPLGGIHAALKASSGEAVFVFGGDMPLLNKSLIFKQINLYKQLRSDVVIPRINDRIEPLHGIYDQSIKNILEDYLEKGTGYSVRGFYKELNVSYMDLEESDETKLAFMNVNYPSDIPAVEQLIKFHHF